MDDRRFVTKLINPLGETRWQPTLPDGVKAWVHMVRLPPWAIEWRSEDDTNSIEIRGPIAYRSRARAVRVAKRQWVKLVENQWESETGSIDPRGVLKPEGSAFRSKCCSPECEATPMAEMPLGIPLCRECVRIILKRSLAYAKEDESRSILKNQKLPLEPVRDSVKPHEKVVYYAQFHNMIKIGYAGNLVQGMPSILPLKILAVEPGGPDLENYRRKQFAHHHEFGEWFRSEDDLIEHIKAVRARQVTT